MSRDLPDLASCRVAILGLGYVGLPLCVEFARTRICCDSGIKLDRYIIAFDTNASRIAELEGCHDRTGEFTRSQLENISNITFTYAVESLVSADVFVVCVPTPVDDSNKPDFNPLIAASQTIGMAFKSRLTSGKESKPVVIYESTVYPGATEEICVPVIEKSSGLLLNKDFYIGYSPERINPGDRLRKLSDICKITSASTAEAADWVDMFYRSIIKAGTHKASSIKVAEAAKIIENTQRDLNIALANELAFIFNKLEINTRDVIEAASTKWNYMSFYPGLVGGHCIGVDPYYLTYKSEQIGYHPQVILSGRRVNDSMHEWIGNEIVRGISRKSYKKNTRNVLMLGLTFKENCSDIRNARTFKLIEYLQSFRLFITVYDPVVDVKSAREATTALILTQAPLGNQYDAVIGAVAHNEFLRLGNNEWKEIIDDETFVYDLKGFIPKELVDLSL